MASKSKGEQPVVTEELTFDTQAEARLEDEAAPPVVENVALEDRLKTLVVEWRNEAEALERASNLMFNRNRNGEVDTMQRMNNEAKIADHRARRNALLFAAQQLEIELQR